MHVPTKSLPDCVRTALKSLEYNGLDIRVEASESWSPSDAPTGDGRKAYVAAVNLATGESEVHWGSWGGANAFNPRNAVDLDTERRPLPEGFVVICGHVGYHPYAWIRANPKTMAPMLPASPELSESEKSALRCCTYKSGYRKEEFSRAGLGSYSPEHPLIVGLANKGLVKITKVGVQVTTDGKNVLDKIR